MQQCTPLAPYMQVFSAHNVELVTPTYLPPYLPTYLPTYLPPYLVSTYLTIPNGSVRSCGGDVQYPPRLTPYLQVFSAHNVELVTPTYLTYLPNLTYLPTYLPSG